MDTVTARWADLIRSRRGTRSQTWLAQQVGVDQAAVSRWEQADKHGPPPVRYHAALIEALDISADEFSAIYYGDKRGAA